MSRHSGGYTAARFEGDRTDCETQTQFAHLQSAVVVAGLVGLVTQSFVIFGIALAVLLAAAIVAGDIRR